MKKILILGAGLSSSSLISYMLNNSQKYDWKIIIGDKDLDLVKKKIDGNPNGEAFEFDVYNADQRAEKIKDVDVVISMLPARMHYLVAEDCVKLGKHMVTASYVSEEIKKLDEEAKKKGILLLNEIGVDPGIDHMSAMQIIDRIKAKGGKITSFDSNTGGLVAPEHDNNPWHYKFTWNPRNVVVAGQGVSRFLHNGRYKYIQHHNLFRRVDRETVLDIGEFEVYPNRDSLSYIDLYGLEGIKTICRGTMRRPGYSEAWNAFVQLGLTDDTFKMTDSEKLTKRDFINSFLRYGINKSVEQKVADYLDIPVDGEVMEKIKWTGIFDDEVVGLKDATPAQLLQKIIEPKWQLDPEDKDMIVMQHIFEYELNGKLYEIKSSLVVKGKDTVDTAMSITVGIPVAIATKLLLTDQFSVTGVQIPVISEMYNPILKELEDYDIKFIEEERIIE
jgi:saccharopine dehydrogenase-like NADP-dependent oxidoreductase